MDPLTTIAGRPLASWLIDTVLLVMLIEWPALALLRRLTGRGPRLRELAPNLLAGLALALGLREAQAFGSTAYLAMLVALAGAMHALDLRRRWHTA